MRRLRVRLLARALAWFGGYFWLPCPVCGKPFAGFEAGDVVVNRRPGGIGQMTCADQVEVS